MQQIAILGAAVVGAGIVWITISADNAKRQLARRVSGLEWAFVACGAVASGLAAFYLL